VVIIQKFFKAWLPVQQPYVGHQIAKLAQQ